MTQQSNQLHTEIELDNIPSETTKMIPSTSKKVPPQQVTRSELSIPTAFVFHVITERQKRAIFKDAVSSTGNSKLSSPSWLTFGKHCIDFFSNPLIKEHHDS